MRDAIFQKVQKVIQPKIKETKDDQKVVEKTMEKEIIKK